jgi:HlyD family secretion protein
VQRAEAAGQKLALAKAGSREHRIQQAEAAKRQAEAELALVLEGPRAEQIAQATARRKQAEAALRLAETKAGYARLVSPMRGVVLSKNVEPGEYVAPGTPVVTVGDLGHPWLRAYINETDLGRVKHGQRVRVTTDTYPGKVYEGRVSFIASEAEFTPKNVQTEKERVKLVYRIKIDIPNPKMELKPGMPADAEILLGAQESPRWKPSEPNM